MLKLFIWTVVIIFILLLFVGRISSDTKKDNKSKRKNHPHIRMLDQVGESFVDEWYTSIAGVFYHADSNDIGGFNGWVEADPENTHDRNAMGVYNFYGKLIGYIPADELGNYRKWCDCEPMPCIGVVSLWNGRLQGKVKIIKPCNKEFLDNRSECFLDWVKDKYGPEYLPKTNAITIYGNKTQSHLRDTGASRDESDIKAGDSVVRMRDNTLMVVEKSNGTEFSCLNASTGEYLGIYSYRDVAKSED